MKATTQPKTVEDKRLPTEKKVREHIKKDILNHLTFSPKINDKSKKILEKKKVEQKTNTVVKEKIDAS